MNFVFLQVGDDQRAQLFVRSIRRGVPQATVIQCTDAKTNAIDGVDRVFRHDGDAANLMTFRLEAFAQLGLKETGTYLDSDMLLLKAFDPNEALKECDVALCERIFGKDILINVGFKRMDWSEYLGKTFGQVYPYLACLTITRSNAFWIKCAQVLRELPPKFHIWYGDQEAIRNVANSDKSLKFAHLKESAYACLPEFVDGKKLPYLIHFKGKQRKRIMMDYAQRLFG